MAEPRTRRSRGRHAARPGEIPPRGWRDIGARVRAELRDDHVTLHAAGVAFYGFLASIPALAAVVSTYALFTDPADVQRRVESLFGALPEEARALLSEQLSAIVGQAGGAIGIGLAVGIALSLWSASSGMGHLVEAVDIAYDERDRRSWLARKALALAFTLGAVLFVVAAGVSVALLTALSDRLELTGPAGWLVRLLWVPVVMVAFTIGLAVLYRYAPDRDRARWRWVSWGSVVAVVIWVAASVGFQVYVSNFGSYNKTYGSLAAVVVLLFWLYLSAFAVLLGAEVNAEIEHQTGTDTTVGPARAMGDRGATMADTLGEPAPSRR